MPLGEKEYVAAGCEFSPNGNTIPATKKAEGTSALALTAAGRGAWRCPPQVLQVQVRARGRAHILSHPLIVEFQPHEPVRLELSLDLGNIRVGAIQGQTSGNVQVPNLFGG
jgi:hypothetical protein